MASSRPLKIKAHVQVQLTITVTARSSWGADCTAEQIHKQAVDETRERIASGLRQVGFGPTFDESRAIVTTYIEEVPS